MNKIDAITDAVSAHCVRINLDRFRTGVAVKTAIRLFMSGTSAAWAISSAKRDADAMVKTPAPPQFPPPDDRDEFDTMQDAVIGALRGHPRSTITEIVRRTCANANWRASNRVGQAVRALVRMGLVVSRPGPTESVYSLSVAGESRGAA